MRLKNVFLTIIIIIACSSISTAYGNLEHLKSWVGKVPHNFYGKSHVKFFQLAEVRGPLRKLLSKTDFHRLTVEFGTQQPITQTGDYLEVRVCKSHCCPCENGSLIINLKTGVMYVGINSEPENKDRWFSTKGSYTDLPMSVRHVGFK